MGEGRVTAVLLAAGAGSRMGMAANKVLTPLTRGGPPLFYYSLSALERNSHVEEILLVTRPEEQDIFAAHLEKRTHRKPLRFVPGGRERSDSVLQALERAEGAVILLHDGARPFLKQRYIDACVEAMDDGPGAVMGVRSTDTIREVNGDSILSEPFREELYQIQTPQCFHTKVLLECHNRVADKASVTDDSALLIQCGYPVKVLPGDASNLKVTYAMDRAVAAALLQNAPELKELRAAWPFH